jgi:hypothetical protein
MVEAVYLKANHFTHSEERSRRLYDAAFHCLLGPSIDQTQEQLNQRLIDQLVAAGYIPETRNYPSLPFQAV